MGNKNGGHVQALLDDFPAFEANYTHIDIGQIGKSDSTCPTSMPIEKRHTINADSGGHRGKVYCANWAQQHPLLVSGSQDGKILFFSGHTGARVQSVPLETSWIKSVDLSMGGDLALAGSPDGILMAKTGLEWGGESPEAEKGKKKKSKATRYVGHENGVNDAKFTGTTNFVTGSGDYRCAFWDISNPNSYIHPYSGHEGDVQSVAVCGEMFASGSCDCSAKLWDIRGTECVRTYADHDADINSVVISSDGKLLVTGSGDSTCIVYDLRAGGKPLITLEDQKNAQGVQSIDISPKGHHVVVGHENQIVRVWNLNTGNFEGIETGHTKKIGSVRFSKCGKLIAIGSHDQSTTIWSVPYAAGPASPKKKSKMKFSSFKKGKSPRNKS